jgi:hypothetical protein
MIEARILDLRQTGSFSFRWPNYVEDIETAWICQLAVSGQTHTVRYGLGSRPAYGRQRVHAVTWLDGNVEVEGVEADDYPDTQALISLLRHPDKTLVRTLGEVPAGYAGFTIMDHHREIDAKFSRRSLAAKIGEDDLLSWGIHAWLRSQSRRRTSSAPRMPPAAPLPPAPSPEKRAITEAILAHGRSLAQALRGASARFTPDEAASQLIHDDPFAFLVAVICDRGTSPRGRGPSPTSCSGTLLDPAERAPACLSALTWATRLARTPGGRNAGCMPTKMANRQIRSHSDGWE